MRIGLDLRMAGGGSGIDRYITELSHEILKSDKRNEYVLFLRNLNIAQAYQAYGAKIVIADIPHYSLSEQTKLPGILLQEKVDLMHFPHFNVPIRYNRPFVVTIHDLTHTLFPGKKKSHFFHRVGYRMVFSAGIKKSKKIIAVSESTKKQILEFFRVPPDKIRVVYEGSNSAYHMMDKNLAFEKVSQKFNIQKPFLLYVGVWRRYKNLPMLARAFDRLKEAGADFELVLAGEKDPGYPEIPRQVAQIRNHNSIRDLGRVSDHDLNWLYNAATVFVLPSLIEGFGLTALEAAATGTPIACSDIPPLREILGQGAEYFDPENLDNMTEVLANLLHNAKRLEDLANLGLSRAKHFGWKKAAEETIQVYEEALI